MAATWSHIVCPSTSGASRSFVLYAVYKVSHLQVCAILLASSPHSDLLTAHAQHVPKTLGKICSTFCTIPDLLEVDSSQI